MEAVIESLRRQVEGWGLALDPATEKTLFEYALQLSSYREANVVGTKDLSRLLLDHVLDSLSCLLCEPMLRANSVVDVGTGGGLPGIPLKIVRPELGLTLVEATGKKVRFLNKLVNELSLDWTK